MFMLCVRVGIESIKHTEEGRGGLLVYRFTREKLGSGLVPSLLCAEKAHCGRGFCFLRMLKCCLPGICSPARVVWSEAWENRCDKLSPATELCSFPDGQRAQIKWLLSQRKLLKICEYGSLRGHLLLALRPCTSSEEGARPCHVFALSSAPELCSQTPVTMFKSSVVAVLSSILVGIWLSR